MVLVRYLWAAVFLGFAALAFKEVSQHVPMPYMDEFFHVKQTLQYAVDHDFWTWDAKITTPPGLYILGFGMAKLFGPNLVVLRSVNALALSVLSWFVAPDPLIVLGFPLLAFYSNLYYTDVWSTLLVLGGFEARSALVSALLLFASLWFRQTNIVWAGLAAAFRILQGTRFDELWSQRRTLLRNLVTMGAPYIVVAALFGGFLKWNGSIALGDKSNHGVAIHGAQVLYYLMFSALFSAPLALTHALSGRLLKRLWLAPVECAAIYAAIQYGTIAHPFILADNRHYTFYLWRRLITPYHGVLLVPVYWASWRWFITSIDLSLVRTWAFIAAALAVLVPSPLLEPRYFIVPYLVWRLFLYGKRGKSLEYGWYLILNQATVLVFCLSSMHFMW